MQVQKRSYGGLSFTEEVIFSSLVPATMTIDGTRKLALNGKLVLDFHEGSYAYNDEAVLSVWSAGYPAVRERPVNDGWGRSEIVLPISSETRDFFLDCAREVDARLRGVK